MDDTREIVMDDNTIKHPNDVFRFKKDHLNNRTNNESTSEAIYGQITGHHDVTRLDAQSDVTDDIESVMSYEQHQQLTSHRIVPSKYLSKDANGDKVYTCSVCGKSYKNQPSLFTRHMRIHDGVKPFKCEKCGKRFRLYDTWKRHQLVHDGIKPLQCTQCPRRFRDISNLTQHMSTHRKVRSHVCVHCNRSYKCARALKIHLCRAQKQVYSCLYCERYFESELWLRKHLDTIHEVFYDELSEAEKEKMIRQIDSNDGVENDNKFTPRYKCTFCDIAYWTGLAMKNHVLRHHNPGNANKRIDLAQFLNNTRTEENVKIPNVNSKTEPKKQYQPNGNKRGRKRTKPLQGFECQVCFCRFATEYFLTRHITEKHADNIVQTSDTQQDPNDIQLEFKCQVCNQAFKTLHAHNYHMSYMHKKEYSLIKEQQKRQQKKSKKLKERLKNRSKSVASDTDSVNTTDSRSKRDNECQCLYCGRELKNHAGLRIHLTRQHNVEYIDLNDEERALCIIGGHDEGQPLAVNDLDMASQGHIDTHYTNDGEDMDQRHDPQILDHNGMHQTKQGNLQQVLYFDPTDSASLSGMHTNQARNPTHLIKSGTNHVTANSNMAFVTEKCNPSVNAYHNDGAFCFSMNNGENMHYLQEQHGIDTVSGTGIYEQYVDNVMRIKNRDNTFPHNAFNENIYYSDDNVGYQDVDYINSSSLTNIPKQEISLTLPVTKSDTYNDSNLSEYENADLFDYLQSHRSYKSCKCGCLFTDDLSLALHKLMHDENMLTKCGLCGNYYKSMLELYQHIYSHDK